MATMQTSEESECCQSAGFEAMLAEAGTRLLGAAPHTIDVAIRAAKYSVSVVGIRTLVERTELRHRRSAQSDDGQQGPNLDDL